MFLLWILVLIGIPLVLGLRSRVKRLEGELARQQTELQTLTERLRRLRRDGVTEDGEPIVAKPPVAAPPPLAPPPAAAERPPLEPKREAPSPPPAPVRPPVAPPAPAYQAKTETPPPPPPRPPRREPPPLPPEPPAAPAFAIDWEAFVGVKLFSAIAGIALVLAAIFFLRYSIEQGWLGPPIRVAIGVIVATALLVVCELKAARKYAVTANALDAAAIAILFATFYAARALWDLIPASVTFGLLDPRHGARRAAVDPPRLALHRGARPARWLRDAGAAVDRREPADPAVHVPAAAERRTGVGRVQERMAAAHHPDA